MMQPYGNQRGDSGVVAFEIGSESIVVAFRAGIRYLYTYRMPGKVEVETMKKLARAGEGLSTYISQRVCDRYERKL